tara:strand:+ start:1030 stop:1215 length:186 start_codon:yes stop_codon:yes gene_type:complete
MDYKLITNIQVSDIDFADSPDFCDAYIESADYNGAPMTQNQLEELCEDRDYVHSCVIEQIH